MSKNTFLQPRTIAECLSCQLPECDGCPRIDSEVSYIENCRICNGKPVIVPWQKGDAIVKCSKCGYWNGKTFKTKMGAARVWNNEMKNMAKEISCMNSKSMVRR